MKILTKLRDADKITQRIIRKSSERTRDQHKKLTRELRATYATLKPLHQGWLS